MQYTVTIDSGAVATAAGKDPSAVDHWLSNQSGTLEQEVVTHLADAARAADPALADAPPPEASGGAAPGTAGAPADPAAAAAQLAALEAALDSLPDDERAAVRAHLEAQGITVAGGGSPV